MPTVIKGQPTSAEVIARLKVEDRPVLLAFSCGKDSLGAWCALRDAGIEVIPAYLWGVPHLGFVDEEIAHFETLFGCEIRQYPHPSFYRILNSCSAQTPPRVRAIAELDMAEPTYEQTWGAIKDDLGLPQDTWVADGVRAADSIVRRASFVRNGVMKRTTHKVSPIADMLKGELMELLGRHGVDLPMDYKLWGRSWDGTDYRFVEPMVREMPDEYAYLKRWWPLLDTELYRGRYIAQAVRSAQEGTAADTGYRRRNANEAKRRSIATDGASVMRVCFAKRRDLDKFCQSVGTEDMIVPHEAASSAFPETSDGRRAQRIAEPRLGRLERTPFASMEYTGDLQADSFSEAGLILKTMEDADRHPGGRAFTDTGLYRCIVFPSRDDMEGFCRRRRLLRFGFQFLDGSRWMATV
ncbi:hypothetical protein [Tractidigestivibacter sp.]|uniref:hypothetical protein n=1 Tax=Tractidigestivibacter sp. TaxID=2847320 RepID=UPI002A91AF3B|nr:hypothetical protein [Tractidigestivibacter sp.]MDY5272092.1 hypothetical protein [Tractidigestivibacter sp.]